MNQLKAGAILNYIAIILNMVIGLLYTPYMLQQLGQSEYGLFSLASSIVTYLTILDLGFGNAIIRYTAKLKTEQKDDELKYMYGMFLILYSCIGLIAILIGVYLVQNVESLFSTNMTSIEISRTKIMLYLMTFNLAITFPMSIWGSIMIAHEKFIFLKTINIIRNILNPLVIVILLSLGYKAVAMVVATTIFNIIVLVANFLYCKFKLHIRIKYGKFNPYFLKEVSIYSFWIFLQIIMDKIYWSSGQFIIGIYRGAAAIAIFAIAMQLQNMYMLFSTAISGVLLPKVTALITKKDNPEEVSNLFIRIGRIQYILIAYILTAFIIFGYSFIRLWAGELYTSSYYLALLVMVPFTIDLIQNIGITILQARNQLKERSFIGVISAVFTLIIAFPSTKYYGELGCSLAIMAGLLIGQGLIMNIYYYKKQKINIPKFWCEIFRMSIIPCLFIIIFIIYQNYIISQINTYSKLFIYGSMFSIIYIPLFYKFSMNANERTLLIQPIKLFLHIK